ncbi:Uncharacterised protein [Vibrio cholerae]|uniref:Uncharacterized protein n=1 Tax=Vibrio cholerae TaxID=666 RepID=A0A655ZCL0_VIBCL|nr:Uncharacterised protein [Vibrio cholerae]CSB02874.1 Uncharacterised protein [Vibrio cholerae]CSB45581.1 Uncharacterised protein [Vibrio cholerae]CSB60178.1 Uncharacterised protein [Vibrio cholerae]CSB65168.1 Uncharacterised protein [Vibrio cholerae]
MGNRFAHANRGTRRRIDFMAMMSFNDFDITVVTHHFGGFFQQFKHQVDTNAVVGRHDNRDLLCCLFNGLALSIGKARCANHQFFTMLLTQS